MTFKAVFDAGKSYEEVYENEEDLIRGLENFYALNKDGEYPFDVQVYNEKGTDISESQFITEIINNILGEY